MDTTEALHFIFDSIGTIFAEGRGANIRFSCVKFTLLGEL